MEAFEIVNRVILIPSMLCLLNGMIQQELIGISYMAFTEKFQLINPRAIIVIYLLNI